MGLRMTAAVLPAVADVGEKIWVRVSFKNESPDAMFELPVIASSRPLAFGEVSLVEEATGRSVAYTTMGKWLCDPNVRWDARGNPVHERRMHSRWLPLPPKAEMRGEHDFELTDLFVLDSPGQYGLTISQWAKRGDRLVMIKLPSVPVTVVRSAMQEAEQAAPWSEAVLGVRGRAFALVEYVEGLPDVSVRVALENTSKLDEIAIEYGGLPALELWELQWQRPTASNPTAMHEAFGQVPERTEERLYWLDVMRPGETRHFLIEFRRLYWREDGTHRLFLSRRVFFRRDGDYSNAASPGVTRVESLRLPPVSFEIRGTPTDALELDAGP